MENKSNLLERNVLRSLLNLQNLYVFDLSEALQTDFFTKIILFLLIS
jgi:hypothetical protein